MISSDESCHKFSYAPGTVVVRKDTNESKTLSWTWVIMWCHLNQQEKRNNDVIQMLFRPHSYTAFLDHGYSSLYAPVTDCQWLPCIVKGVYMIVEALRYLEYYINKWIPINICSNINRKNSRPQTLISWATTFRFVNSKWRNGQSTPWRWCCWKLDDVHELKIHLNVYPSWPIYCPIFTTIFLFCSLWFPLFFTAVPIKSIPLVILSYHTSSSV